MMGDPSKLNVIGKEKTVVYYESIKRDGRLQTKRFTRLSHWVGRGTGTPKDKDEVNKREVCECEG
jgi:hypothetical protein